MPNDNMISKVVRSIRKRGLLATSLSAVRALNPAGAARQNAAKLKKLEREANGRDWCERTIHGSIMRLDVRASSKHSLEHHLAIHGTREPLSTEYFISTLSKLKEDWASRPPTLALDLGANVGYFALIQASLLSGFAKVIAVEAEEENAERLEHNIGLNGYDNIKILNVAVGAEVGSGTIVRGRSANRHRMSEISTDSEDLQAVEVVTIDQLIVDYAESTESPIIVRMDIEGYEGYAFEGMKDLICSARPCYMFFELHTNASEWFGRIAQLLELGGFIIERIDADKGEGAGVGLGVGYDTLRSLKTTSHIFCRR